MSTEKARESKARLVVEEWLGSINHHHLNLRFEASDALQQIIAAALDAHGRAEADAAWNAGRDAAAQWHDEEAVRAMNRNHVGSSNSELRHNRTIADLNTAYAVAIRTLTRLPQEKT